MGSRPAFGAVRHIPDEVTCAWGARFIWPDDLLWDRQDMVGSEANRAELEAWLNDRALAAARITAARMARTYELDQAAWRRVVLYEDGQGIIVGDPQASCGYLYVAAWLKPE